MYKELQLHGHNLLLDDVIQAGFTAIESDFDCISVPTFFLSKLKTELTDSILVSALIDFPYGMSNASVRQHSSLDALHKGANAIDLAINTHWVLNAKPDLITEDIQAHQKMCEDHDATFKISIDYRRLRLLELRWVFALLCDLNIEYASIATGHFMDNFADQLAVLHLLQDSYKNIDFIMNGTVNNQGHLDKLAFSKIFGVKLHSAHAIRILFPAKIASCH